MLNTLAAGSDSIFFDPKWKFVAMKDDQIVVFLMLFMFDGPLCVEYFLIDVLISDKVNEAVEVSLDNLARAGQDLGERLLVRGGTKTLQFGDLCDEFFGRLFKIGFGIGVKELLRGT